MAETPTSDRTTVAVQPWPLGLKWFAFRAVFVFALLQWLPLAFQQIAGPLTFGLWSPPNMWGTQTLAVGQWIITMILRLPDHSDQTFMSANSLPLFLGMVGEAAFAVLVASGWTLATPRTANPRLFSWLFAANRYMLAGLIFMYGWSKVVLVQFSPSLDYYVFEVAQHNPRDLLWAFMSGSNGYQFFAGVVEVGGGLMLLSRRTMILGALLSLAAMGNVLAMDIGYDVAVKFIALDMFLMTVFALAPYARVLIDVLIKQVAPNADAWPRTAFLRQTSRVGAVVVTIAGVWLAGATLYATVQTRDRVSRSWRTPLFGIWEVEQISRDGRDVPLVITRPELWRRFVFQSKDAAVVFLMSNYPQSGAAKGRGNGIRYSVRVDEAKRLVQMTPFQMTGTTERLAFTYSFTDTDHMVLTNSDEQLAVRLRRFDAAAYPLVAWKPRWSW